MGGVFFNTVIRYWVRTRRAPFSVSFLMLRLAKRVGKKEIGRVESYGQERKLNLNKHSFNMNLLILNFQNAQFLPQTISYVLLYTLS